MSEWFCFACSHQNPGGVRRCEACQVPRPGARSEISRLSGKFTLVGVIVIALGVIGTALGTWWGPPALLPGIAFYLMGRFF
jgi:hypothetical protein